MLIQAMFVKFAQHNVRHALIQQPVLLVILVALIHTITMDGAIQLALMVTMQIPINVWLVIQIAKPAQVHQQSVPLVLLQVHTPYSQGLLVFQSVILVM